jgi:cytoskeleton protein RodZ
MNEPALREEKDYNYYTDMPVGEILRRARVHYGQSLANVEAVLRIRASQLEAIEQGDLEKLPGRVYAIGFVRSYSEYLGLDGNKMVQLFKAQSLGSRGKPELHFPVAASESKIPNAWVIVSSIAAVVALALLVAFLSGGDGGKVNEIPPVPEEIRAEFDDPSGPVSTPGPEITDKTFQDQGFSADAKEFDRVKNYSEEDQTTLEQAEAVNQDTSANAQPVAETGAEEVEHRVTIKVTERSWVEIRDDSGKAILSRTLEPGNTYFVPKDHQNLVLTTGNAAGLTILVDGESLPDFGGRGEVRRNIPLNAEKLKKHLD